MRFATWNIHKFAGSDGKLDPERTIATLRGIAADIVAIQEFVAAPGSNGSLGAEAFAAACGYRVIEQPMRRRNGKPQSNLLLARVPLDNVRLVPLRCPGIEERGAICADMNGSNVRLRIAATHLGLPPMMRLRQLQDLLEACDPGARMPFVLLGDLNVLPLLDPAGRMLRRAFGAGSRAATYPSRFPLLALDRIAMRGANGADKVQAWRENCAALASDHLPLVADLELARISSS